MSAQASNKKRQIRLNESGKDGNKRFGLPFIGGGIFLVLLFLYLITALYYKSHFYTNTVINSVSATNMTVSKAEEAIDSKVKAYQLTIKERENQTETINGKNIDLHMKFNGNVTELLDKQNPFAWPVSLFGSKEYKIKTMMEYSDSLLEQYVKKLKCLNEAGMKETENATISAYGENGYEIVSEEQGTRISEDKLYNAVRKAVRNLETSLSVEKADCYQKPLLTSESPKVQQALKKMNKLASAKITYKFGTKTEVVDGSKISKWISIDDNYNVTFHKDGVKEYVDYIGSTYNSFGRIRTFKTSYGKTIKVKGGDYGWWMNRPKEVTELIKLIKKGAVETRVPAYFQTAQQYGDDDIGDTYVEVNLTAQHLFFYKDGKKILDSDFVSGNVSRKLGTPVGTYPVQYKERNATLVGETYSTPVKYWMPFNRNIGLHDASWRHGRFGGKIYMTDGSHGCINMPPANAKKMFKYMEKGVAVVVYELPGSQNYDTGKHTDKVTKK